MKKEPSTDLSTVGSQPLAPIGTPTVDSDVQTGIRSHTNKYIFSWKWKITLEILCFVIVNHIHCFTGPFKEDLHLV